MQKKSKFKTILIIVLCVIFVVESVAVGMMVSSRNKETEKQIVYQDSAVTMHEKPANIGTPDGLLTKLLGEDFDIGATLRGVIYSDSIVSAAMSAVYPMLYDSVKDMLNFTPSIHLFGTGNLVADYLGDVPYTAVDTDGVRKPLTDVLRKTGENWNYMKQEVTWTDEDGKEQTASIFNSIDWGVHDMASFYTAMNDAACGFRGLIEYPLQNKEGTVVVNIPAMVSPALSAIPINLDAAKVFNKTGVDDGTGQSGYEYGIIYLFNLLGLDEGEYPSNEEFCNYQTMGEVFKGLIETIIYAVEKMLTNPLDNITTLLMNLVNGINSGELVDHLTKMMMYGKYHPLAKMAMGLQDDSLFNLGETILNILNDAGIPVYGNFNELLQGAMKSFLGEDVKAPLFRTKKFLATGTEVKFKSGNTMLKANPDTTIDFLVKYLLQDDLLKGILGKIDMFDAAGINEIIDALHQSRRGIRNLLEVVLGVALSNL